MFAVLQQKKINRFARHNFLTADLVSNPCDPLTLYTCTSTFSKVITWKYCSSSITGIVQTESESKKKTIFQTSSFDYIKPTKTYKDARNLRFNRSFLQMNKFTPNLIHNRD